MQWIRDFFEKNGPGCNAVIGISGGKDSSVVAALCVEALGKDRVNRFKPIGREIETPHIVAIGTIDITVLAQEYVAYSVTGDFITITGTRLEDNEVVAVETVQTIPC